MIRAYFSGKHCSITKLLLYFKLFLYSLLIWKQKKKLRIAYKFFIAGQSSHQF